MAVLRPRRLRPGDRVAIVSPSWGGPSLFPAVYESGLRTLREDLGLEVVEMPHARDPADVLDARPELRAADLHAAFADESIAGIITSIGGDDSVRVLPHLDPGAMVRHPKVLLGYSDTATLLSWLNLHGLVTYNGPSVMAGLAQARALPPAFLAHLRAMLMEPAPRTEYRPYGSYSDGYPDWADASRAGAVNPPRPAPPWSFSGEGVAEGPLFGGCIEVLEFLKGTRFWPPLDFWDGRVLFLETSEDVPSPAAVKRMVRNYGTQGVLERIAGLLFGRPRDYDEEARRALRYRVARVLREFGRGDLPVVFDMDFGHTDPQVVLPLGLRVRVEVQARRVTLLEAPVDPRVLL